MIVIEKFVYSKFDVNYYIVNLTSIIDFYKRKEGINQLHTLEFLEDFNTLSLYQCIYYKRKQGLNRLHAGNTLRICYGCDRNPEIDFFKGPGRFLWLRLWFRFRSKPP